MRSVALVLGLSAVLASCGDLRSAGVEVGRTAPTYGAVTLAGDSANLNDLEGRVVLLNVWATWCGPCREEIPALQELYELHNERGFDVVGVSIDGRGQDTAIRNFAESYGVTYPLWHDPDDYISTRYRLVGVPATFLIDRGGVIRWFHLGPVEVDDARLNEALERALAAS
jgi:peroxiredoxin